jgi:hypothetical protein
LLIEESRTNAALYSGALVVGTGWAGLTTSTISGTGPDGNSSYEITESTTSGVQTIANSGSTTANGGTSVTTGTTYTGSIFLKKVAGSIDWVQITHGSVGFGTSQYANINLSNGTIGNSSGGTARVETYANGWYRVSWTAVATATTTTSLGVIAVFIQNTNGTTRTPSYAGSTSNKFLAAMAQFEVGSFPTSYIPTTTGSVVRSADVCSIAGSDFTGFWNQNEGTIFADSAHIASPFPTTVMANSGANSNQVAIFRQSSSTCTFGVASGGLYSVTENFSITSNQSVKMIGAYSSANSRAALNGNLSGLDTSVVVPTNLTRLNIGAAGLASQDFANGHIAAIRYYRKRLQDAKLVTLTT